MSIRMSVSSVSDVGRSVGEPVSQSVSWWLGRSIGQSVWSVGHSNSPFGRPCPALVCWVWFVRGEHQCQHAVYRSVSVPSVKGSVCSSVCPCVGQSVWGNDGVSVCGLLLDGQTASLRERLSSKCRGPSTGASVYQHDGVDLATKICQSTLRRTSMYWSTFRHTSV